MVQSGHEKYVKVRDNIVKMLVVDMGYSIEEIGNLLEDYIQSQVWMPAFVSSAILKCDFQSVLDWLGSPVEKGKLASKYPQLAESTLLHLATVRSEKTDFPTLLLQFGASVDAFDATGTTPFLYNLMSMSPDRRDMRMDRVGKLLYEWGASATEDDWKGDQDIALDEIIDTVPLLQSALGGRRCELINLTQRKDLIGQTCVVEKFVAKKNRYKVTTEHTSETFLVRPDNLKRRDRTPEDPGHYVTFEDGVFNHHTFASNEECQKFVRNLRSG